MNIFEAREIQKKYIKDEGIENIVKHGINIEGNKYYVITKILNEKYLNNFINGEVGLIINKQFVSALYHNTKRLGFECMLACSDGKLCIINYIPFE